MKTYSFYSFLLLLSFSLLGFTSLTPRPLDLAEQGDPSRHGPRLPRYKVFSYNLPNLTDGIAQQWKGDREFGAPAEIRLSVSFYIKKNTGMDAIWARIVYEAEEKRNGVWVGDRTAARFESNQRIGFAPSGYRLSDDSFPDGKTWSVIPCQRQRLDTGVNEYRNQYGLFQVIGDSYGLDMGNADHFKNAQLLKAEWDKPLEVVGELYDWMRPACPQHYPEIEER